MSTFILNKNIGSDNLLNLIEICKSSSMTVGKKLREAHYALGRLISSEITKDASHKEFAILVMMRAGLFYANGIADKLEDLGYPTSLILLTTDEISDDDLTFIRGKEILIVDAVINTGKSIFKLIKQLSDSDSLKIATTVIPKNSLHFFESIDLYTVRTSDNQYIGSKVAHISNGKGPDTGDRLFNTM